MQLIWLRSDLRVHDNSALHAAMRDGPTVALYLLTPGQWRQHDDAPCKVDFWLRNLARLRDELQRLNVPLLVRQCDDWSAVPELLGRLCHEQRIDTVHINDEYGINEQRRDQATATRLAADGVALQRHLDQLLFQPGSLLTRTGDYYKVYSQFRALCLQHLRAAPPVPRGRPAAQAPLPIASDTIADPLPGCQPPADSLRSHWPAGEPAALEALTRFADEAMEDYAERRDIPAEPGTSRLSPYLAAGVLSPRQCLHAALTCNQGEFDTGNSGATTWINELLWREFYKHILVGYPRVSRHRAFRPQTEALPWRDAPQELLAWQQGRTGLPIIDAAMRQLQATGWMHNRLRMLVAMFLSKNLLIDWREGERFFMRHLIDGDLAANNGGWQWSASTGTDAVPYFRLFNPITQSQRFDPKGRFIRHWLPELAGLDDKAIHAPPASDLFNPIDYPTPIVDLAASRERALAAFRDLA